MSDLEQPTYLNGIKTKRICAYLIKRTRNEAKNHLPDRTQRYQTILSLNLRRAVAKFPRKKSPRNESCLISAVISMHNELSTAPPTGERGN